MNIYMKKAFLYIQINICKEYLQWIMIEVQYLPDKILLA